MVCMTVCLSSMQSHSANTLVPDMCQALGKLGLNCLSFSQHPLRVFSLTFPGPSPFSHFDFQVCNSGNMDPFTQLIQDSSDSNPGQPQGASLTSVIPTLACALQPPWSIYSLGTTCGDLGGWSKGSVSVFLKGPVIPSAVAGWEPLLQVF